MSKTYLVTTSDDRSGRKGGVYGIMQNKLKVFVKKYKEKLRIDEIRFFNWDYMYNDKQFYDEYKNLLEWVNPDINGLLYKPYYVLKTLEEANEGDYVIYNDVSPEMWKNVLDSEEDFIRTISPHHNIEVL